MQQSNRPRLSRDIEHKMLGGVCAGIAKQYGYDVTVVRIVTVLLTLVWGAGLILYLALWAIMPAEAATPGGAQPVSGTLEAGSTDSESSGDGSTGFGAPVSDDLAERARRAADDFAIAARSAAEAARVAAEQLADVAKAATAAGRESWEQQRAARQQPEGTSTPSSPATGEAPPPPTTPPPDYETTPPPGPDDARPDTPTPSP